MTGKHDVGANVSGRPFVVFRCRCRCRLGHVVDEYDYDAADAAGDAAGDADDVASMTGMVLTMVRTSRHSASDPA